MAASTQTVHEVAAERKTIRMVVEGAAAEGLFSGVAFVLALIGLSGILPEILLPVAVISAGLSLMFEGGAVATRYYNLLSGTGSGGLDSADFRMGLTSEFLGGITGVVLGILALLGIRPLVLVPSAVVVFGSVLMFGSAMETRLSALETERIGESSERRRITHEVMTITAGAEFLLGLGAAVLGIIALVGTAAMTLGLIGILVIGLSGIATGTAVAARVLSLFRS